MSKIFAAIAVAGLVLAAAPARAVTVTHVGYRTPTGAVADRSAYDQVFEAEALYQAGQYSGSVAWPVEAGFPWMTWLFTHESSQSATFTVPTDEIVVQVANMDFNDGLVLVYVDGVLLDTVNVRGEGDLGSTPVTPGFYIEVTGLPLDVHTVMVKVRALPGCYVEIDDGVYEVCDDLHFDFVAGRQR